MCYGVRSNETAAVIFPKLLYSATAERASELMHLVGRYSQDSEKLRSRIIQIVTVLNGIDIFRRPFTKTKKRNKKYEFNGRYLRFFFFYKNHLMTIVEQCLTLKNCNLQPFGKS